MPLPVSSLKTLMPENFTLLIFPRKGRSEVSESSTKWSKLIDLVKKLICTELTEPSPFESSVTNLFLKATDATKPAIKIIAIKAPAASRSLKV